MLNWNINCDCALLKSLIELSKQNHEKILVEHLCPFVYFVCASFSKTACITKTSADVKKIRAVLRMLSDLSFFNFVTLNNRHLGE